MIDARGVAVAVAGILLLLFGGVGTLFVLLGAVVDVVELTVVTLVFPLLFVVGAAALGYGAARAARAADGDLWDRLRDFDVRSLARHFD